MGRKYLRRCSTRWLPPGCEKSPRSRSCVGSGSKTTILKTVTDGGERQKIFLFLNSPYDPEAHLGKKRSTLWTGYKVHLTETCELSLPHLITHVATTPAPRTDEAMTESIQQELHQANLAPGEHFVDAGYVSARVLVNATAHFGIEVVGPVSVDIQWQAHCATGIDASQFVLDWDHQQATCPQGKTSSNWTPLSRKHHPDLIKIQFSTTDCSPCPRLGDCVHSTNKYRRRTLTVRPQAQHTALQVARRIQRTDIFQQCLRYELPYPYRPQMLRKQATRKHFTVNGYPVVFVRIVKRLLTLTTRVHFFENASKMQRGHKFMEKERNNAIST